MPDKSSITGASVNVREERPGDVDEIRFVNDAAFAQPDEGQLIATLRANRGVLLSLVAVFQNRIVGHILYSPADIDCDGTTITGAALGPMAVLPGYQRRGIGSKLIEAGTRSLREAHCPFIIVLGHPRYYPRFGFEPASSQGITCQWDVPDKVFMTLILDHTKMKGASGAARYRPEFSSVA